MSRIHRSALVGCGAQQIFDLVNDVEAYPRRFEWCDAARVRERGSDWLVASLDVRLGALKMSFATRNTLIEPSRIEMRLVEGPFSDLTGVWEFRALGDIGCKVSLSMDFEVAGKFVGSALAIGFQHLADRMVDDFVREARIVCD